MQTPWIDYYKILFLPYQQSIDFIFFLAMKCVSFPNKDDNILSNLDSVIALLLMTCLYWLNQAADLLQSCSILITESCGVKYMYLLFSSSITTWSSLFTVTKLLGSPLPHRSTSPQGEFMFLRTCKHIHYLYNECSYDFINHHFFLPKRLAPETFKEN